MFDEDLALLRIPDLGKSVSQEIISKLKLLMTNSPRGLIIDVRGCAIGELDEAFVLADFFLDKGAPIATIRSKTGSTVVKVALTEAAIGNIPIVILVNSGTSGASEVFAAALKDNGTAELIGERTNGEGSLQKRFLLEDGSCLFLTTDLIVRPSGELIQAEEVRDSGLSPDITSPSREFVTDFYYENSPVDQEEELNQEFYEHLDEVIQKQQLDTAVEHLKDMTDGIKEEGKIA
jgi:carboxyl-terminal processing protease